MDTKQVRYNITKMIEEFYEDLAVYDTKRVKPEHPYHRLIIELEDLAEELQTDG